MSQPSREWVLLSVTAIVATSLFATPQADAQERVSPPACDLRALSRSEPPPRRVQSNVHPSALALVGNTSVRPIIFVPSDLTLSPTAERTVRLQMEAVQNWYAEQLDGKTFILAPVVIVRGTHPVAHYFGPDYLVSRHEWGYELWNHVWADVQAQGVGPADNEVVGVFFHGSGASDAGLGGGRMFLTSVESLAGDCLEVGCAPQVNRGGIAHELGHALGLPHPSGDDYWTSVMGGGFYSYPRTRFVNSTANPEVQTLTASPFISSRGLIDEGFESCPPNACSDESASGMHALRLTGDPTPAIGAMMGQETSFDITALVKGSHVVKALLFADQFDLYGELKASSAFEFEVPVEDWQRRSFTVARSPAAHYLQIRVLPGIGSGQVVLVDAVHVRSSERPSAPLPLKGPAGQPKNRTAALEWTDVSWAERYRVQVSTDLAFDRVVADLISLDADVRTPELEVGRVHYWRVAAENGSGSSGWCAPQSFIPWNDGQFVHDQFETFAVGDAWSVVQPGPLPVRGNSGAPARRPSGYLALPVLNGSLEGKGGSAKNLLLRSAPAPDFEIAARYDVWSPLGWNHSGGGLLIYQDQDNYASLFREYRDAQVLTFYAEKDGAEVARRSLRVSQGLPIRMTHLAGVVRAEYSPDGVRWLALGETSPWSWSGSPLVGLVAGGRSAAATEESTIYVDWFTAQPLSTSPPANACPPLVPAENVTITYNGESSGCGLSTPCRLGESIAFTVAALNYDLSCGEHSYQWQFGDGSSAEGRQVEHVFTTAGSYTASVLITQGGNSVSLQATLVVTQETIPAAPPDAPRDPTVVVASATSVSISWTESTGAASYEISRRAVGGGFTPIGTTTVPAYVDSSVVADSAYLYRIAAINGAGRSPDSDAVLAMATTFTDSLTAGVTPIKAAHILELRTAVNALRALAGYGPRAFVDPSLVGVPMKAVHVAELRSVISSAREAAGIGPFSWAGQAPVAGSVIRASHLAEMRTAVTTGRLALNRFSFASVLTPGAQAQTLNVFVSQLDTSNGNVTINGGDSRGPSQPFVFTWGDGQTSEAFFPATHTYADRTRNYVVTVQARYNDGSTDSRKLVVRFVSSQLASPPSDDRVRVSAPTAMPTLATRLYPVPPALGTITDQALGTLSRSVLEGVLEHAAAIQYDFVGGDVFKSNGLFEQYVLRDANFGGAYSAWYTTPPVLAVGDAMWSVSIPWSSLMHEMGHNTTLNFPAAYIYGGKIDGNANAIYSETMGQIFQHATGAVLLEEAARRGIPAELAVEIEQDILASAGVLKRFYDEYVAGGKQYRSWNDPATAHDEALPTFMTLGYVFLTEADARHADYRVVVPRLMDVLALWDADLQARYSQSANSTEAETFRGTLMAAAFSHAFGADLRPRLRGLNFPVNDTTYEALLARAGS